MSKKTKRYKKTNQAGREKTTLSRRLAPAPSSINAARPQDGTGSLAIRRRGTTNLRGGKTVPQSTVAREKVIRIGLPTHRSPNKVPALRSTLFEQMNSIKKLNRDLLNKLRYVNPAKEYT